MLYRNEISNGSYVMNLNFKLTVTSLTLAILSASTQVALADDADEGYCMDVEIQPFHMMPGFMTEPGACAVRDYMDNSLQEAFYPFTEEEHLFNCEVFGDTVDLPVVGTVPTSVASQQGITGTIGGHTFEADLYCASLTNYYQDSCVDPEDPTTCTFQLAQPFLSQGLPFPRVTEVSVFDGVITVDSGRRSKEVPIVMATRAAGITHVEDPSLPLVGASVTHSLLGMVTYDADDEDEDDRELKSLDGSADLLLQGHIFFPGTVEEDVEDGVNKAAVIKGSICSEDLYKQLNRTGGGHGHHGGRHHDDD
jgi:hypothetical protein